MKLYEIVNAATALRNMVSQEISLKTAYRLSLLVDKLDPHLSYFDSNRERISKLADAQDKELDDLLAEEVDIEFEPVKVKLDENIKISAMDILSLKQFVVFESE